jgi:hypothetical protein
MGECCYALAKAFHPECFVCAKCKQKIGSGQFHLEDGMPYCPKDYQAMFAQKCAGCDFPIEAGDQFFEAINQFYHVECFTCTVNKFIFFFFSSCQWHKIYSIFLLIVNKLNLTFTTRTKLNKETNSN